MNNFAANYSKILITPQNTESKINFLIKYVSLSTQILS
jgi:hypothetical protein